MSSSPHFSVLLPEFLSFFADKTIRGFVDATLGAGGHSAALLQAHPEVNRLVGFDQDPVALSLAKSRLITWESKIDFFKLNFVHMKGSLSAYPVPIDGILLDLGVSSMQLDTASKGFSFSKEGPLDMRMDPSQDLTAEEIVNTWSEQELGKIFREWGEEKQWHTAARILAKVRQEKPLKTTQDLVEALLPALRYRAKKGIHPLTLIFQALRIAVNRELEVLEKILPDALSLLTPGGRLAVITFHSLEDRLVKNFFRFAASDKYETSGIGGMFLDKSPEAHILTRRPLVASEKEINQNARSRSAKLRVIEKI
ncbi:Ribosomal RNA small subunit methyltransferase H [Neochlamydia sp. TUME1]|uniref:16S rRNA (cytosine(1402)-N(4))-methyltransferase RsmH n=1 Tax=Neochlamydia sp. TUME1 TaxID=1478174 RepID=UPI00057FFDCE|nr:16S rRNA (cytosine(1402)-N(4))-methyltransferase RsmH [Neochlamydia sp. TUME1]KIC77169.1 Ribosomal RNA small subunit methyltransferase H [Neochlamydia sp. TUME1]